MRKNIEISCNFYLKRKQIFAQFLHDFRAKTFDWRPDHQHDFFRF